MLGLYEIVGGVGLKEIFSLVALQIVNINVLNSWLQSTSCDQLFELRICGICVTKFFYCYKIPV